MKLWQLGAIAVLGSLVLPTLAYVVLRRVRPGDRPKAAKVMAWLCMWIGQLAIPLVLTVMQCVDFTARWWRMGAHAAAILYGIVMGFVAIVAGALAGQTFALGPLVLSQQMEQVVAGRALPLSNRALLAFVICVFYGVVVMDFVKIPGREWAPLWYLAAVLIPVGFVSLLVLTVASALKKPPWLPPVV